MQVFEYSSGSAPSDDVLQVTRIASSTVHDLFSDRPTFLLS